MVKTLQLNSNKANYANNNNASHYPNVPYKLTNGTGATGNGHVANPFVGGYTYNINPCTTNNSATPHSTAMSSELTAAVAMPHQKHHKVHSIATASSSIGCVGQSPTKLSVAGPITDL
uniref:Genome polyprotein 1 n=1 Tax=Zeugodacus cucurbitae TaxID=28588 RepID=A0A0A1XRP6_ZEUCU